MLQVTTRADRCGICWKSMRYRYRIMHDVTLELMATCFRSGGSRFRRRQMHEPPDLSSRRSTACGPVIWISRGTRL